MKRRAVALLTSLKPEKKVELLKGYVPLSFTKPYSLPCGSCGAPFTAFFVVRENEDNTNYAEALRVSTRRLSQYRPSRFCWNRIEYSLLAHNTSSLHLAMVMELLESQLSFRQRELTEKWRWAILTGTASSILSPSGQVRAGRARSLRYSWATATEPSGMRVALLSLTRR